jgi:hypothetical protein
MDSDSSSGSMGSMQLSLFLNLQPTSWKTKYIYNWISAGGPIIGAPRVIRGDIYGDNLGIVTLPEQDARLLESNSGSGLLAAPFSNVWKQPVLISAGVSYAATDLMKVWTARGRLEPFTLENRTFPLIMGDPNVNVTLVYGSQLATAITIVFASANFTGQPTMISGDGDSTVPTTSSTYPLGRWRNVRPVNMVGVKHSDLIANPNFYQLVLGISTQA